MHGQDLVVTLVYMHGQSKAQNGCKPDKRFVCLSSGLTEDLVKTEKEKLIHLLHVAGTEMHGSVYLFRTMHDKSVFDSNAVCFVRWLLMDRLYIRLGSIHWTAIVFSLILMSALNRRKNADEEGRR